jgi:hypothetical protein
MTAVSIKSKEESLFQSPCDLVAKPYGNLKNTFPSFSSRIYVWMTMAALSIIQ